MTHPAIITPQAAATYYRQACGWTAQAAADMVWLRASEPIEALRMPAPTGARVRDVLCRTGIDGPCSSVPVITVRCGPSSLVPDAPAPTSSR